LEAGSPPLNPESPVNDLPPADRHPRPPLPENLQIRAAAVADAEGICTIANLPGFRAGTLRLPYQAVAETRKWLENAELGSPQLVAILNGTIVGNANLRRFQGRRQHVGTIGMGVHDGYAGRGIGSALLAELVDIADNWLNIRRLELTVYTDNEPALRLYRRFGFVEEGTLRDFAYRDGRYVDAYSMARLR
jgi:L-phenylalanine/L-methionine N-acetyltransferase